MQTSSNRNQTKAVPVAICISLVIRFADDRCAVIRELICGRLLNENRTFSAQEAGEDRGHRPLRAGAGRA